MLLPTRNKRLNLIIWLKALGLGPAAITCAGKSDGGGAQVHAVLSVQAFCRRFGISYAHTPFSQIEHTSGPQEVARWEETFALGKGHASASDLGLPLVSLKTYARRPALWFQRVIVALPHAHDYADRSQEDYQWYRANKSPTRSQGPLRIAIHVRRGDVTPTHHADRYTPDAKILATLDLVLSHMGGQTPEIHVYSQGRAEDFAAFSERGCVLHLDEDALTDLAGLASADILIIGKSSFSYVAALLSQGLVIYEPFWHKAGEGWISGDQPDAIHSALAQRIVDAKMTQHITTEPNKIPMVVTGIVRNCGKTLESDVRRIGAALSGHPVQWLLIESDSTDNTVAVLEKLAARDSSFRFETLGALDQQIPDRLQRISYCRNLYVERICNDPAYRDTTYVAIADYDGINTLLTAEGVKSCWKRTDWDVVCANQAAPYYDVFALRHPLWSPNDCWAQYGFLKSHGLDKKEAGFAAVHSRMLRIKPNADWIEVESAFGGFAICRKSVFEKARYSGTDENGGGICEHVMFHRRLREQGGRVFINPALINSGYNEHTRSLMLRNRILRMPKNILRALTKPFRLIAKANGGR